MQCVCVCVCLCVCVCVCVQACFAGGMFALGGVHATNGQTEHYINIGKDITSTCHMSYARTGKERSLWVGVARWREWPWHAVLMLLPEGNQPSSKEDTVDDIFTNDFVLH